MNFASFLLTKPKQFINMATFLHFHLSHLKALVSSSQFLITHVKIFPLITLNSNPKNSSIKRRMPTSIQASSADIDLGLLQRAIQLLQSTPPTLQNAALNNLLLFLLGSPILVSGLSFTGIAAAFLLGTLTWRAFGSSGFLLVASYSVIGTLATKVKNGSKGGSRSCREKKRKEGSHHVCDRCPDC